ncbi:hypothetical protein ACIZ62_08340 [Acetobacterium carbinolicum]|uniref:hypothetical protein n=1 Tax=Acetobacterium carbinolicum TaxID=52690 RepID=UPI0039BF9FDE
MKNTKIKNWICNFFSKKRTALADQLGEIDTSVYEQAVKSAVGCSSNQASKTMKIGRTNYTVNLHFLPDGRSIEDCVESIIVSKAKAQAT